jgi:hypothetical protein
MKKIYRNFTNEKQIVEAFGSITPSGTHFKYGKSASYFDNIFVKKVLEKLKEDFDFEIKPESYWLLEHRPGGHKWHKDTGTSNHMMWCQVGISVLLKEPETGGDTWYGDDEMGTNAKKSDRKVFDLVAHTSDEYHMVDAHKGSRVVFLMFI